MTAVNLGKALDKVRRDSKGSRTNKMGAIVAPEPQPEPAAEPEEEAGGFALNISFCAGFSGEPDAVLVPATPATPIPSDDDDDDDEIPAGDRRQAIFSEFLSGLSDGSKERKDALRVAMSKAWAISVVARDPNDAKYQRHFAELLRQQLRLHNPTLKSVEDVAKLCSRQLARKEVKPFFDKEFWSGDGRRHSRAYVNTLIFRGEQIKLYLDNPTVKVPALASVQNIGCDIYIMRTSQGKYAPIVTL